MTKIEDAFVVTGLFSAGFFLRYTAWIIPQSLKHLRAVRREKQQQASKEASPSALQVTR